MIDNVSNVGKAIITRVLTAENVVAVYAPSFPPISQEINEIWYLCSDNQKKSICLVQRGTYATLISTCQSKLVTNGAVIIISDHYTEKSSLKMIIPNCLK